MFPWHEKLSSWAKGTGLRVDALGLVTILGTEEINNSVGRLVPSPYFDLLPLLGAFVIAGNRFTEKKLGFALYSISSGFMTTELSGWFSRWLAAQEFHRIRSKVTWTVESRPMRWSSFWIGFVLVGLPCNGMLTALTVLSEDWWGFANAMAMMTSVLVRYVLVSQNRAGIDRDIKLAKADAQEYKDKKFPRQWANFEKKKAEYEKALLKVKASGSPGETQPPVKKPIPPQDPFQNAKAITVLDNANVITIQAPEYLLAPVFAKNPQVPNPHLYAFFRWLGWIAFTVHIVSIGMAALHTQIYTVVLLVVATVLNVSKVGCDDSDIWKKLRPWKRSNEEKKKERFCWISSSLRASFSEYPEEYCRWKVEESSELGNASKAPGTPSQEGLMHSSRWSCFRHGRPREDEESKRQEEGKPSERRQDLFVWLDLTEEEEGNMEAWALFPRNDQWCELYKEKKREHSQRTSIIDEKIKSEQWCSEEQGPGWETEKDLSRVSTHFVMGEIKRE